MELNIGIIGLGTVGSGVIESIEKNKNLFLKKYNIKINICGVSAKNKRKKRSFNINRYKWYKNPLDLINNSSIEIIVELIGGDSGLPLDIAIKTLTNKKNLITANKAMMAIHGKKLIDIAFKNSVNINYEASVAGGIPIINMLENSLLSDKVNLIYGILNGTSNYILTQMREKKISFDTALKEAQNLGFAELDPFDDISGNDAAYKLLLLSNLTFGLVSEIKDVYVEGITEIESIDLEMANKLGYSIILLGIAGIKNKLLQLRVHPCLVNNNSIIAKVKNELNTVIIEGDLTDKIVVVGKGAGKNPTASAVLSDIIDYRKIKKRNLLSNKKNTYLKIKKLTMADRKGKFYIRMSVVDSPGVLADITAFFKRQKISISTMFQLEKKYSKYVQLIFVTHLINEKQLILAIKKIEKLAKVKNKVKFIRIENSL